MNMLVNKIANEKLDKFLKEKGVFDQYVYNVLSLNGDDSARYMLSSTTIKINNSFQWRESKEGHTFWEELHLLYCGYYC